MTPYIDEGDVVASDRHMRDAWGYDEHVARQGGGTLSDLPLGRYALQHHATGAIHLFELVEHAYDGRRVVYQWRTQGGRKAVIWSELPGVVSGMHRFRDEAMRAAAHWTQTDDGDWVVAESVQNVVPMV